MARAKSGATHRARPIRGKRPYLTRRQVEHARVCLRLWRKCAPKVVAARLGLKDSKNLREYILGRQLPIEDWLAERGLSA